MIALTRQVSRSFALCELTHKARQPIDLDAARAQHDEYERALAALGVRLLRLPEEPLLADSVFVEDVAVVVPELCVVTRPGAETRRAEAETVAEALSPYRPLHRITKPGTLDGGDVLRVGKSLFVGSSGRTNEEGIRQLREALAPFEYKVSAIPVRGCLHLKSAVTAVTDDVFLMNPDYVDPDGFGGEAIFVHPDEPDAANVLRVVGSVIYSKSYPRTLERLLEKNIRAVTVDVSEIEKAEGAVTCCSVLIDEG